MTREEIEEPYEDAISRQALQEWIKNKSFEDIVVASEHNFDCLPSVTPQPETGYWMPKGKGDGFKNWNCSKCGMLVRNSQKPWYKHCPDCGAKMESEDISQQLKAVKVTKMEKDDFDNLDSMLEDLWNDTESEDKE